MHLHQLSLSGLFNVGLVDWKDLTFGSCDSIVVYRNYFDKDKFVSSGMVCVLRKVYVMNAITLVVSLYRLQNLINHL